MLNYIPLDFYAENKNTVYAMEDFCKEKEGSAVPFDPYLDLTICDIVNGEVVVNPVKDKAKKDLLSSTKYQRDRADDYPPLQDQLDKIYHDGLEAWKVDIKVIKDRHPKPV